MEDRVREPNEEERSLIRRRRDAVDAVHRKAANTDLNELFVMAVLGVATAAAVWWFDGPLIVVLGVGVLALLMAAFGLFLRGRRAGVPASRWGGSDDLWRVHETRVRARSVVFAQGAEESDFTTWMLFEIPGGRWAVVDALWFPPGEPVVARAMVCIRWLEPALECIGVEAVGDALPRHGAVELGAGDPGEGVVEAALANGFVWPAPDDSDTAAEWGPEPILRIDEAALPAWMRDAVRPEP